jgi:hypothetical protein
MQELRRQLNEYLACEFGCDTGDEHPAVSSSSPFELSYLGSIDRVSPGVEVFSFDSDGESFFAVAGSSLTYLPIAGMTLVDLADQFVGARWIGSRDPIDSNTSMIGDDRVPPANERRQRIQTLVSAHLGPAATVLEGLFLCTDSSLLALAQQGERVLVIGDGLPPLQAGFPTASRWRRLSAAVGAWIRSQRA